MNKYLVSYDLNNPPAQADYHPLIQRLKNFWRAERVLYSEWFVRTNSSATAVRDDLAPFVDANDGLLVLGLTGEAAWSGSGIQMTTVAVKNTLAA